MPSPPHAPSDEIEMSTVFAALRKRARWLVLTSLALGVVTFAILSLMAPRYRSEAELAIVAPSAAGAFSSTRPDLVTTRMDREAINTHVKAMQSPELLGQVADKLDLKERAEFNSALGPIDTLDRILRYAGIGGPRSGESERDRVLSALRDRLQVYAAKESRFIGVRATSIDPVLAAKIANELTENYRKSIAQQGVVEVDDQQDVLQAKIDKLTPEVVAAETEASRYRGKIDGFEAGAQNTGLNQQQMSELTGELTKANAARGEAEARAKSAREMMKAGSADALPDVQKSPLIQNLTQQRVRIERQISELSATLLPGHPRMRQLEGELAGLKKQIHNEVAKIVDSLEKEAKIARGREESIAQSLKDIKARVVNNAPEAARLNQLEAIAKAKRTELHNLQAQLESNRKMLDARAQPIAAEIIAKAQPASVPVFPRKGKLSGLMAFAALMFGVAWTVAETLFKSTRGGVGTPAQRRTLAPVAARPEPSLSIEEQEMPASEPAPIPRQPEAPQPELQQTVQPVPQAELPPHDDDERPVEAAAPATPTTPVTERDMAALARHLQDQRRSEGGHRTILTGEPATVDASAEALELSKAIADAGRYVLLIDWSPSGEGWAENAGLDASRGFNDLLRGDALFDQIIQRIPESSAHAIASGSALAGTDGEIDPDQLNLILDALDEAYDHIIVAGRYDEARKLFEIIEGRFDAGIVVVEAPRVASILEDVSQTFLGFDVADIDLIRFERQASAGSAVSERIARVTEQRSMRLARRA